MMTFSTIKEAVISFVYPVYCDSCKKVLPPSAKPGVCDACLRQVKRHPEPYCAICGRTVSGARDRLCHECRAEKPAFTAARSACLYEGVMKELIHRFKYKNRRSLAGLFAGYMLDLLKRDTLFSGGIETVAFVPLHRRRLRERDFNQSEALAKRIAGGLGLPVADCIEKIRRTASQNELSRRERLVNLKGSFRTRDSRSEGVRDRVVLLVDDVMTTGATLDECGRTLLAAGAREVRCLTAARGT